MTEPVLEAGRPLSQSCAGVSEVIARACTVCVCGHVVRLGLCHVSVVLGLVRVSRGVLLWVSLVQVGLCPGCVRSRLLVWVGF